MSGETVASLLIGTAVGALITWAVTFVYYLRAARDLRKEASNLQSETVKVRLLVNTLARALFKAGHIDAVWNDRGGLEGLVLERGIGSAGFKLGNLGVEAKTVETKFENLEGKPVAKRESHARSWPRPPFEPN